MNWAAKIQKIFLFLAFRTFIYQINDRHCLNKSEKCANEQVIFTILIYEKSLETTQKNMDSYGITMIF